MSKSYDLIAVGSGSAASGVAMKCRRAGWSVALIDERPLGGTCALRGCDPKKVLIGATEALDWAERLEGKGVRASGLEVDWPALMRFKRGFVEPVPENREKSFAKAGVDVFHGHARFTSANTVAVEGSSVSLEGRYVHIGSGAKPRELDIPGTDLLTSSEEFLELETLPRRLLFVGGGYISFEFAHIAARAGAQVTLVHRSRPLKGFDPDLVTLLVSRTRELGIDVHLETEVLAIEKNEIHDARSVRAVREGKEVSFVADCVVHGAGRVPAVDDLGLDDAGVEFSSKGVVVNEYLQSVSNPVVYAAGDAAATKGDPLTPVAAYEGHLVARNLLEGNRHPVTYPPIPSVVFTLPSLARVGMLESEATEKGVKFRTQHRDTPGWFTARRVGEETSAYKVLVEEGSNRILGAHLVGPHAEEVINLFAMAMHTGLTPRDVKKMIFAYPTAASDMVYMV